jgi:glycosyltransferase involved in cell wall biosynthesis
MHVAFLTPEYPHEQLNSAAGLGTSIKNLADALIERGHQITVFVCNQEKTTQFENDGILIHSIKKRSYKIGGFYFYRKYVASYINDNSDGIDVLEAPDWTGITAFCGFAIPHAIKIHGSDTYFCHLENRPQKKKNRFFESLALKNADGICAVSTFSGSVTKELFDLKKPISTCYNIIDTNKFTPREVSKSERYILNFGSIIRKKGVIELAEAFNLVHKSNPDVFLFYLGGDVIDIKTGNSTISIIESVLSKSAMQKVKFLPKVSYEKVLDYIAGAELICLPSHAEAFPMTWLEAMAMKKPLVASNVGWSQEIIDHKRNGFAVDPNDAVELSNAIREVLSNPEFGKEMGKNARLTILMKFNADKLVNDNLEFYQHVISQTRTT